ncbi:MAG: MerC domain-containing protein [Bacteroidota bacterium]
MTKFFRLHLDFVGFGASLFCALHCIVMFLMLPLGLFAGAHWLTDQLGEWIFIGLSIGVAASSLPISFFKKHQNIYPLLIAGLGFVGLLLTQLEAIANAHGFMAIGGGLIAYAHFYNWQLTQRVNKKTPIVKRWNILTRIATIVLLLLYCLGLYTSFAHNNKPPDKKEMLKAVWQVKH